ncbi:MAG TPA: hypothetical protein VER55_14790, partial [Ardenticatenaceae bacterium]|nr:hypothetical protein [Ardenticatenaceae bacterium]
MKRLPANAPRQRSTHAGSSFSARRQPAPRWLWNLWRWLLILALLVPATTPGLAPSPAQAATSAADEAGGAAGALSSPAPTAPIPPPPSSSAILLAMRLTPDTAGPGETVTMHVTVTNPPTGKTYAGVVLESVLPAEVIAVVGGGDAVIVPGTRTILRWLPALLAPGTTWQGSAQVRLRPGVLERDLRLEVAVVAATPPLIASSAAQVSVRHPGASASIGPAGGSLQSSDGRIRVDVPAGAVTQTVELRYTPQQHWPGRAVFYSFDLTAQAGSLPVTSFARPLTVTLRYTDRDVATLVEPSLRLTWVREAANGQPRQAGTWPGTVYTPTNAVVAQVSHFSTQTMSGDPGTIVPASINDFQVGLYSGSASFALPLDLPPGAAGLAPRLQVRYDSSRVNQMYDRYSQAGWLGVGWGLNLGSIQWRDNPDGGAYAINFNGLNGDLSLQDDGFYHTRRESYARIQFVGTRTDHNQNSEWRVWSKEGTRYTFGGSSDARLWSCAGTEIWKLKKITDTAGNTITIDYQTNTEDDDVPDRCGPNESYPHYIRYSTNPGTTDAQTNEFTVEFAVSERPFIRADSTRLYETMKLDSITLKNAASEIVRKWVFSFADAAPPTAE